MDIDQLAIEIIAARESNTVVEPPSRRVPDFSIEHGYAVGRWLHQQRLASGARPVGFKLGFTNQAAWEAVGRSDEPVECHLAAARHSVFVEGRPRTDL